MAVCAGNPVDACASKTSRNNTLFLSPVSAEGCDEVAVAGGVGALWGSKMTSFGVGGLALTRVISSVGPTRLGAGGFEVIWLEMAQMGGFSSF
jgi:hypothetical protein